jgi:DNA/RNA endonuclease YhcR with UshA esterase domain
LSTLSQPALIELKDVSKYEEKSVIVEGIVTQNRLTNYGSQIITIESDNASATVFIEGKIEVEYGDKIQATGKVQKYKGDWEIVVDNENFVKVIQKWQNISIPLWQLSASPEKYEGLNVNVTGYIDTIYDTYFYLADPDGNYSIIVFCNPSKYNVHSGQKVSVAAKFIFNKEEFRYRLDVSDETHGIFMAAGD